MKMPWRTPIFIYWKVKRWLKLILKRKRKTQSQQQRQSDRGASTSSGTSGKVRPTVPRLCTGSHFHRSKTCSVWSLRVEEAEAGRIPDHRTAATEWSQYYLWISNQSNSPYCVGFSFIFKKFCFIMALERWFNSLEHWLLFQRLGFRLPASM